MNVNQVKVFDYNSEAVRNGAMLLRNAKQTSLRNATLRKTNNDNVNVNVNQVKVFDYDSEAVRNGAMLLRNAKQTSLRNATLRITNNDNVNVNVNQVKVIGYWLLKTATGFAGDPNFDSRWAYLP